MRQIYLLDPEVVNRGFTNSLKSFGIESIMAPDLKKAKQTQTQPSESGLESDAAGWMSTPGNLCATLAGTP